MKCTKMSTCYLVNEIKPALLEAKLQSRQRRTKAPTLQRWTYMAKKYTQSNKNFGYSVGKDVIFTHLTDFSDQINALETAVG